MDPETLITFLFRAPPEVRTVELLGSWDNFSHPYRMHYDRLRGKGAWSGCFKFLNVIYDGDQPCFHKPRTGGLKQGGTYWYFYRLDDQVEAYDDSLETTAACPLLPGQSMNVIVVPTEVAEPLPRSRSASLDAVATIASLPSTHTLEPGDKFAALAPPPISKVHTRCVSEIALVKTNESRPSSSHGSEVLRPRERNPHFSSDPPLGCDLPQRYYSNSEFADDRSSLYSRQSWSSVACSSSDSLIHDAYEMEQSPFAEEAVAYFPATEPPPMPCRAPPAIPALASEALEISEALEETRPRSSPPMPSRPPPAIPVETPETPELVHVTTLEDTVSCASPTTPQDETFPQYPPADFRPNLQLDIHRLKRPSTSIRTNLPIQLNESPIPSIRTPELSYQPRHSGEEPAPSDSEDDEILSPTFSAATVSSRGGLNTPFRVSIGQLCQTTGFASADESMDRVTERLRSLGHGGDEDVLLTTSSKTTPDGYPSPIAEVDETTFPSFSSACSGLVADEPKLGFMMERSMTPQPSLTDAIFRELGHLGASIA